VDSENNKRLTHVAGTFLIQADGAFLNGAGLGEGEDRNVTIPKTFSDGRNRVPYVSAQAWKRWLRTTAVQEAGWPPSEPQAIGWNPKGNVNKVAPQLNPVEFPEDDIFGYMRAQEGRPQARFCWLAPYNFISMA
jgi:CRISPR-associated protein Cst2